jgi:hypothetical protein
MDALGTASMRYQLSLQVHYPQVVAAEFVELCLSAAYNVTVTNSAAPGPGEQKIFHPA